MAMGRGLRGRTDQQMRVGWQAWAASDRQRAKLAMGAGDGRGGGTERGLRRAAKPQSSVVRLWLVDYRGHRQTLFFLPGIISLFIMLIGII